MRDLIKLSNEFLKISQQTSVQAGDICDAFPEYFPRGGVAGSSVKGPLDDQIIAFVSEFLPAEFNVSIIYIINPGFIPSTKSTFIRAGEVLPNPKWAAKINGFVSNLLKDLPSKAKTRMPGVVITNPIKIGPLNIS